MVNHNLLLLPRDNLIFANHDFLVSPNYNELNIFNQINTMPILTQAGFSIENNPPDNLLKANKVRYWLIKKISYFFPFINHRLSNFTSSRTGVYSSFIMQFLPRILSFPKDISCTLIFPNSLFIANQLPINNSGINSDNHNVYSQARKKASTLPAYPASANSILIEVNVVKMEPNLATLPLSVSAENTSSIFDIKPVIAEQVNDINLIFKPITPFNGHRADFLRKFSFVLKIFFTGISLAIIIAPASGAIIPILSWIAAGAVGLLLLKSLADLGCSILNYASAPNLNEKKIVIETNSLARLIYWVLREKINLPQDLAMKWANMSDTIISVFLIVGPTFITGISALAMGTFATIALPPLELLLGISILLLFIPIVFEKIVEVISNYGMQRYIFKVVSKLELTELQRIKDTSNLNFQEKERLNENNYKYKKELRNIFITDVAEAKADILQVRLKSVVAFLISSALLFFIANPVAVLIIFWTVCIISLKYYIANKNLKYAEANLNNFNEKKFADIKLAGKDYLANFFLKYFYSNARDKVALKKSLMISSFINGAVDLSSGAFPRILPIANVNAVIDNVDKVTTPIFTLINDVHKEQRMAKIRIDQLTQENEEEKKEARDNEIISIRL